jgi:hypothetical protein
MKSAAILGTTLLLLATPLAAQNSTKVVPVQFAKGTSSTAITDSIRGDASVNYTVAARAGQTMTVTLTTSNRSSYFNVTAPGADAAMFIGSSAGNRFSTTIPSTGTYTVQIYLMRNAARRNESAKYTVAIAVR